MKALFDANVWIAARNEVYGPAVFPGVWTRLAAAIESRLIASPGRVLDELARKDDELNRWISPRRAALTEPMHDSGLKQRVENSIPELREKYRSLSRPADYDVVAWGKALGWPVVTLENQNSSKKIPAACRGEGVQCVMPLEFMRRQGWKFPAS